MEKKQKDIAIKVDHVSMHFNMASEMVSGIKDYLIKMAQHKLFYKDFIAVDNVSFEVKKGEVFGIVGTNGSGKSTILKMVSGILEPTHGTITINGKIAPLIELGAGFDGELTARENIFLNGAILGYDKDFLEEKFTEIVDFADIWNFLDMPIKNYSSGMIARIAFAIATIVQPDILIVDEILAVGDFLFQQKCENRIKELMSGGTTVLIVSHSIDQIEALCDRVLWIEKSKPRMIGRTFDVCNAYRNLQNEANNKDLHEYQIVAEEICHICGNNVAFRDEPGMTYKSEAFCSVCGAKLRTSDLVGKHLEYQFYGQANCLNDIEKQLSQMEFLCCASDGLLHSRLRGHKGFHGLTGHAKDWSVQARNVDELGISKQSLDFIIFEEYLICDENPVETITNLCSLLKPGGYFLMSVTIHEKEETFCRDGMKHKIYQNGVLVRTQWGKDAEKVLEKCGLEAEMHCTHRWYQPEEQPDLKKEKIYQKYMDSHPYYFYKFNSWVLVGCKRTENAE